jgi:glyoxylase-like metal-dependent hydrolase (beta-lactamase superfamily II)
MAQQIPIDESAVAAAAASDDNTHEVALDLAFRRLAIVNVVFFGRPGAADREWVLIDAGVFGTTGFIESTAEKRFGKESRPSAIVLTHGHFDHIGGLKELADKWDAPIYAHPLEHPYLDGTSSYPPPDPTVGGGLMALLSPLYPKGPIEVTNRLRRLPEDGTIPGMPGWRWLHTPGHSPGHISLWRERDALLVAGDAFVTTAQESVYAVATQEPEMHGPPMYFTPDWARARASVEQLAALEPETVVTGHGPAMRGEEMRRALHHLADNFNEIAVPDHGRYVPEPA